METKSEIIEPVDVNVTTGPNTQPQSSSQDLESVLPLRNLDLIGKKNLISLESTGQKPEESLAPSIDNIIHIRLEKQHFHEKVTPSTMSSNYQLRE